MLAAWPWIPSQVSRSEGRNPHLDVKTAEQLLEIPQDSLDLDHDQQPEIRVVGEEIDPSAVAVMVEADLGSNQPAPSLKRLLPVVLEERVTGVDEQPRISGATGKRECETRAERVGKGAKRVELEPPEAAGLEVDECGSGSSGPSR